MDQVNNLHHMSEWLVPWGTFLAGLAGSLHCIGMCGGLVTATCQSKTQNASYQLGRLFSYMSLGVVGALIGESFSMKGMPKWSGAIPALFIGLIFMFMGMKALRGQKMEFPMPKRLLDFQAKLFGKFFNMKSDLVRPLGIGLISILLPCGFLYAVVFAVAVIESPLIGFISMGTFWLGTVPAMAFAPEIFQKILNKVINKSPRLTALTFVSLGVVTIVMRMVNLYGNSGCEKCH